MRQLLRLGTARHRGWGHLLSARLKPGAGGEDGLRSATAGFGLCLAALALAAPAEAASGTWDRAWGKNVNGGGVFGICTTATSCLAGTTGGLGGELNTPVGVATDAGGNVYVADITNERIQKFDPSGTFERTWGKGVNMTTGGNLCTAASGDTCQAGAAGGLGGELTRPRGLAAGVGGNVYVADTNSDRIQKFDSAGTFERTWGKGVNMTTGGSLCTAASGDTCQAGTNGGLGGEFAFAPTVATDAGGNVYSADGANQRIQRFDSAGTFERTWGKGVNMTTGGNLCTAASGDTCQAGTAGGLGGEFNASIAVATDPGGKVYVADQNNNRIQRFDSAGTFERTWGKGVNMTTGGNLCTAASGDTCQAGTSGGLGGELNLPSGVATDAGSNLYVGDRDNHRIQKFADAFPPSGGGANATAPSNAFTVGKVKGTKVELTAPGPGEFVITDSSKKDSICACFSTTTASGRNGASAAVAKALLKFSTATVSSSGTVTVPLALTGSAKKKLRQRGKLRVNAAIAFTPTGGTPSGQVAQLKVKKKK